MPLYLNVNPGAPITVYKPKCSYTRIYPLVLLNVYARSDAPILACKPELACKFWSTQAYARV